MEDVQPVLLSIPAAAKVLGIGRGTLYKLIGDGELPSLKIEGRRLIPTVDIAEYIDRQLEAEALRRRRAAD